jgi:hypothetical protein
MTRSTERFLTTHTGSLPRPDDLVRTMYAKEEGIPVDQAALAARVRSAVAEAVTKQTRRWRSSTWECRSQSRPKPPTSRIARVRGRSPSSIRPGLNFQPRQKRWRP